MRLALARRVFPCSPTVFLVAAAARAELTRQLDVAVGFLSSQLQGTKSTKLRPLRCDRTALYTFLLSRALRTECDIFLVLALRQKSCNTTRNLAAKAGFSAAYINELAAFLRTGTPDAIGNRLPRTRRIETHRLSSTTDVFCDASIGAQKNRLRAPGFR